MRRTGTSASRIGFRPTALLWLFLATLPAPADQPLKKLLALDFELIDEQKDFVAFPEKDARLAMVSQQLRVGFMEHDLYDVVDSTPVAQLIRTEAERQSLLDCNGCELDIARKAGAERVLLGWVQKVSNLILNLNIEVRDVQTGEIVLRKSVDLRGNTDQSWRRAVDFLIRDMVEEGQGNR